MKKILLLDDEATQPTQRLANALPANVPREIETIAGCNCDRWGHPCPGLCRAHRSTDTGVPNFNAHEEMR
jgi:hypothetical protein